MGDVESESLSELVDRVLRTAGESGRAFAKRAAERGHRLSHSTVNDVRKGSVRILAPDKLDAIADTAGISRAQVYAAAGLPAPAKSFVEEIPDGADLLDRGERSAVVAVIRSMVDHHLRAESVVEARLAQMLAESAGERHRPAAR